MVMSKFLTTLWVIEKKMLAREEFRREYAYLYVTSFSNNGLALEQKVILQQL